MREIGLLPNTHAAQILVDYLKGQGIKAKIAPAETGVAILIIDADDYNNAKEEYDLFIQNPSDEKYSRASWNNGTTKIKFDYGKPIQQLTIQFVMGAGPLTLGVIIVCGIIFLGFELGFAQPLFAHLSFFNQLSLKDFGQAWRLFTPSLMHFSALHIIFNLLWWWYLGGKIENKLGTLPLLILLIIAGTLPNLVQYLVAGPNFGGLSGVVYALVGYSWVIGLKRPEAGIDLPPAYISFMLLWLVFGFTDLFGLSIANGAHVAGLIIGILQGFIDSRKATNP